MDALPLVPAEEDAEVVGEDAETRGAFVDAAGHGQRLDKWLVSLAPEFSRSYLQTLIEQGHVRVNTQPQTTASRKLQAGQEVRLTLVPTPQSRAFVAQAMSLRVLHEDDHILVVDKPAGLVVHPAPGNWSGTLLNGLLAHHAQAASLPRAGIVHRLDKDTSGLMVVAKSLPAMTALTRAIADRAVSRQYLALAHGEVSEKPFSVDKPIGRDPVSRVRMAVIASGKPARTDVQRLGCAVVEGVKLSALLCTLHTGRTHQIRVHLASLAHPLVADTLYGGAIAAGIARQALHAFRLSFEHPITGEPLSFRAPIAEDLRAAWTRVAPGVEQDLPSDTIAATAVSARCGRRDESQEAPQAGRPKARQASRPGRP